MILINKHKYEDCKSFLDKHYSDKIDIEKDVIFVLEKSKEKLGYIIIHKESNLSIIKHFLVLDEARNNGFGDGLLRTALNSLRLAGINIVKYKGCCDYLINKGFKKSGFYLECDINEFFSNHNCKR